MAKAPPQPMPEPTHYPTEYTEMSLHTNEDRPNPGQPIFLDLFSSHKDTIMKIKYVIRDRAPKSVSDCHDLIACMAYNLIWVWMQYAPPQNTDFDKVRMDHMCMSSGEDATDLLQYLGLGEDNGWQFEANEEVVKIIND